ncbi:MULTISPECIES: holin family protein [unclassified Phaeobacter]|uniref:holin family protein n=1 Tax=unclassified Phaeobacter TaxID=2621772 RepID=UPI003A857E5F
MGLIADVLRGLFGRERNVVVETLEVFRENAEAGAERDQARRADALAQLAAEFARGGSSAPRGWFDRWMDGLNRLPRPLLALSTLALLGSAMVDPVWFAARMQGLALVPEPLWWLLGVIVSFYFGARQQLKSQGFQREIAESLAQVPAVAANVARIDALRRADPQAPASANSPVLHGDVDASDYDLVENPALEDWMALSRAAR